MEEKKIRYPIGQQDFKTLRLRNCLYVDKTAFIKTIVDEGSQYFFLARPRRFGKSLFLSTLRYFFEGQRELFKGLFIDSTDWNWEEYPVLHLDLNTNRYKEKGLLEDVLDNMFRDWESKYGIEVKDTDYSQRFKTIIKSAHEKTGKQVVILVDEYDKPLVGNINIDDNFEHYRSKLASIYSNFKSSAAHIRLVFLTGVSRFSKLSIFSDLNNIRDITFTNSYSEICGITEKELLDNFQEGISTLAKKRKISFENAFQLLKKNYDGYRFSDEGSDIYNPWSLLNAMADSSISNYWGRSGKATLIAEALQNVDADIERILSTRVSMKTLEGLDLKSLNPVALFYQTGYLTIKDYNFNNNFVTLGIPNLEVKESLFSDLLPFYVNTRRGTADSVVNDIINDINNGDPKQFVKDLDIFLAGIPYEMKMEDENNFHNALYILLSLIGVETETEVHTSDGRIDLVVKSSDFIFIIELKFNNSSDAAMEQIENKHYELPFLKDQRRIYTIGLNFSTKTRRLDKPLIAEISK